MTIRVFEERDTETVVALWESVGLTRPWNDPRKDIARKLTVQPELFLVAEDEDRVVGSVMAGYDGHRGWLYYLASDPADAAKASPEVLVAEVEARLLAMGCPRCSSMVRPENAAARGFYDALGYEPFDTWSTGKRLIAD